MHSRSREDGAEVQVGQSADGAPADMEALRKAIDLEIGRLQMRGRRLLATLDELMERYPGAERLVDDVEAVVREHRRLIKAVQRCDWQEAIAETTRQIGAVAGHCEEGREQQLPLRWDDQTGSFVADVDAPPWRLRRQRRVVEVSDIVSRRLRSEAPAAKRFLLQSKTGEVRHEAVIRALGWALMIQSATRYLSDAERPEEIRLRRGDDVAVVTGSTEPDDVSLPDASAFGHHRGGEMLRRLQDFAKTDPQAHWIDEVAEQPPASWQCWVLRDSAGARLEVELHRTLRRVRIIEQPQSRVVRKRRHVFVDQAPIRRRDRYFATEADAADAAQELLRRRIDDGFRVIEYRTDDAA